MRRTLRQAEGRTRGRIPAEPVRRGRRAGFTLIELLLAATIVALVMSSLICAIVSILGVSQRVPSTATLQSQARLSLDAMTRDIHAADAVLVSYGPNSTSANCLVLEAPSYDSVGNVLSGQHDEITYHLVGASAPFTLSRTATTAAGSARGAQADTVIARNVQSLSLTYLCSQKFTSGDGTTTRFALSAPASSSGTGLIESVNANGTAVVVTTTAPSAGQVQFLAPTTTPSFPQGSILFGTAPAATDTVRILDSVDPTSAASAPQITQIVADLKVSVTDVSLGASGYEAMEFTSTANLHNH